ncbi:MAG: M23 family metallopeptidase [Coriobacteriia bacterium]|nr:M23 family metallopeptidase [Coriobacteriia bacterium]
MRSSRGRKRRRRPSPYSLLIALCFITIVAMLFVVGRAGSNDGAPLPPASATPEVVVAATEPERDPTPRFAEYQELTLRLPIDPEDITAIAFHQASGSNALHMTSLAPDADMELAARLKAVPPLQDAPTTDSDVPAQPDIWYGCVLRLWRSNRTGAPDTAVDCGADAGSAVFSPISGTVVRVKAYKLYEKYNDYEIHIRPDGRDDIDLVLLHVDDVLIAEGDRVTAGVTRIASVRKMSDRVDLQLAGYTSNGGDHVHVQLNTAEADPSLSGADGS